ncbi:TetM/TetW/TetO/TetS family tetracycline resistance ribosomal protection protein [Clostridium sp. PL3]|uniref:TetM/TetW/TetO/TetS family tetracycline resistance ribosomal protection protein n=1 Tax=Clostridium thailandense TaxID=2794346 RepID=A0A949X5K8_9CLOT|nr:TetM/TetW/TetO/TetS family tetracycline resistance ribosomal protection protein [Clostridium thailandense]MBV7275808.1 TetM/TetW/TetO/TetS family tetracycline resistance ribosomal protection protein [Clostridium thailandense]
MKKIVTGILAHVDAGKTTLSESMLYLSGKIRKLGRVDNKDAYLDTYKLEKERGITIFSKQAVFKFEETEITLLDTPGHVDFSAEMERTLQVLDYAILVISGADGIQGHTQTLWRLLSIYKIPVFIFINKMDQVGADKEKLMKELKRRLNDGCIEFQEKDMDTFYDQIAMCDEKAMENFIDTGEIKNIEISKLIKSRKVFPCFFGSALKLEGVLEFIGGIVKYTEKPLYPKEFGAKVFKISRDDQGNRLTFMKITGGSLKVKIALTNKNTDLKDSFYNIWEEKVNQIRIYSGQKFEPVSEAEAGSICVVTGLTKTRPGEGLGIESASSKPLLEPVLSYQVILPEGCDPRTMLPKLREIEEEEPELHIVWEENLQEIQVQIMGEVQIEILQSIIKERFNIDAAFDSGSILYKETILNTVEGVGHFEPLRHYSEVHLLMEPGELGSGLQFSTNCSEDYLEKSWQRLILTHLEEKGHKGILTGSPITDMKITLVAGRAHKKHTEGGDFREATYRAVRQGLMQADSILLEPYYEFQLELPEKMVGRAMTDIEKMNGTCEIAGLNGEMAIVTGSAPVITMRNYQREVISYTKGQGRLFYSLKGYAPCHNSEEIIESIGYDPERDISNPADSVFCANGAGFLVNWDEVKNYMHIESHLQKEKTANSKLTKKVPPAQERTIGLDEIDEIINKTFYANQGKKSIWKKRRTALESHYKTDNYTTVNNVIKEAYLLVDGYNILFAWEELKEIAADNIDAARTKLLDVLCNYQGIKNNKIIVVFDAYRVQGHRVEISDYNNIHVVYTKEAETADQYIEKFVHQHHGDYSITVATSDSLEQIIIRGNGAGLVSAMELKEEIEWANKKMMEAYREKYSKNHNFLSDKLSEEDKEQFKKFLK